MSHRAFTLAILLAIAGCSSPDAEGAADAGLSPDAARPLVECGGLVEGAACNEADWRGYDCFNGNCYFDCASGCSCSGGVWKCYPQGCRSMQSTAPDGGIIPCGQSPRCWTMCNPP